MLDDCQDQCRCGNALFLDNDLCVRCGAVTGFCPGCNAIVSFTEAPDGTRVCDACGTRTRACLNQIEGVCNRYVHADGADALCDCCIHNQVIPDLSIPGNRERWTALEAAKRRVFRTLDRLGLPRYRPDATDGLPLVFDFKADSLPDAGLWRPMASGEKVYTGHAGGRITINVKEADSVERERLRSDFNEGHRTLVGHFRHELGHYYWELLVRGRDEAACAACFGDPYNPDYASALETYYAKGPAADWQERYISAYASMHPWEDFAETFALYLNIDATLHSAHQLMLAQDVGEPTHERVAAYVDLGIRLNELARNNGLQDWMPQPIVEPVIGKLACIDRLIRPWREASASTRA